MTDIEMSMPARGATKANRRWRSWASALLGAALALALVGVEATPSQAAVMPGTTVLLANSSGGPQCSSSLGGPVSWDGRYVLYACLASFYRVFRRDMVTGTDADVSVDASGRGLGQTAERASGISADGQMALYQSYSDQIISHNFSTDRLSIVSSAADGTAGNGPSGPAVLSSNGQWALFYSEAGNLLPGVAPGGGTGHGNIFRKNLATGIIDVAMPTNGAPDGRSEPGGISDDGNVVAFSSSARNITGAPSLVAESASYLRDVGSGTVRQLLHQPFGPTATSADPRISADGKTAAFVAISGNPGTSRVAACSVSEGLFLACRFVTSGVSASDLHLAAGGNAVEYHDYYPEGSDESPFQIFRADLTGGQPEVASVNNTGELANSVQWESFANISGDGSTISFTATATNLDPRAGTDSTVPHAYLRAASGPTPSPGPSPSPGQKILLGLGDSVAAGYGLGPARGFPNNPNAYPLLLASRLGYSGYNYAIAGACAATQSKHGGSPTTPGSCTKSVLSDELLTGKLPTANIKPSVITLTVGANDIQFKECLMALALKASGNPCEKEPLKQNLKTLSRNLRTLYLTLKKKYPGVPIYAMQYYNMFPEPRSSNSDVCPAYGALAFLHVKDVRKYTGVVLTKGLVNPQAVKLQTEFYNFARATVKSLNSTISSAAAAAGVKTVPIAFGGHDFCRTLTGGQVGETWVYGPSLHVTATGVNPISGRIATINKDFNLPAVCPRPVGEPIKYWSRAGRTWSAAYSFRTNCIAHPTKRGQAEIARAFSRHIGR